jgi:hypothetical protein
MSAGEFKQASEQFSKDLGGKLKAAGYPPKADPAQINYPLVLVLLVIPVLYVTLVYGPIAAWLVELFPARIRYTSMSLPYHIGNGWFGGFLPDGGVRARGTHGGHLLRPVVSDRRRVGYGGHRGAVPARDPGADGRVRACRADAAAPAPCQHLRFSRAVTQYRS